ncbi:MAG: PleD family two-component system response regulator [Alphaproteobacteria bacterium]
MTGLILVVDDVPANVKLLEAKLTHEYYNVITAKDGYEALQQAREKKPDLILLDVMMPGMDGFEACRQMKKDPEISHIPVVMVTALTEPSDRVQGLESGADDFITKPINDMALFARVRSLVRIKVLIDELRLRGKSGAQLGMSDDAFNPEMEVKGANVMVIDDDAVQSKRTQEKLKSAGYQVQGFADYKAAVEAAKSGNGLDLILISMSLADMDGLRLATQFKAIETVRHVPIIMMVDEEEQSAMLKGLELGVNDYLLSPIDYNEMFARVKTQIRRKKYQEALKSNYQESVSMAAIDGLTKLYNRHYLDTHLKNLVRQARETNRNLSLVIMDMDHFKQVNDTYGHPVGDEVLVTLAGIIVGSIRSADLAARYGGEEFVILMPETDAARAYEGAERLRKQVESTPFKVSHAVGEIRKTVSIGHATIQPDDTPEKLLQRADHALYEAKNSGRNKVLPMTKPPYAPSPTRAAARSAVEADAAVSVPVKSIKLDAANSTKPSALPYANKSEF